MILQILFYLLKGFCINESLFQGFSSWLYTFDFCACWRRYKLVDLILQIDARRMASVLYNLIRPNENNLRDTSDIKKFNCIVLAIPAVQFVVLQFIPFLVINSLDKSVLVIINAQADNSDFPLPIFFILLHHLLVMRHRSLAGSAPRSPDIQ